MGLNLASYSAFNEVVAVRLVALFMAHAIGPHGEKSAGTLQIHPKNGVMTSARWALIFQAWIYASGVSSAVIMPMVRVSWINRQGGEQGLPRL